MLIFISHSFLTNRTGSFGAFGVSIFIVLSGFLLGLKRTNYTNSIGKITIKKFSKLYPLHILGMIGALLLVLNFSNISSNLFYVLKCIVLNIFCIQSFVPIKSYYFSLNSVAWYLSILLLLAILSKPIKAWAIYVVGRFSALRIFVGMILIYILMIGFVSFVGKLQIYHWLIYIFPPTRMIDFVLGVLFGSIVCLKKDFLIEKVNAASCFFVFTITLLVALTSCFIRGTWLHPYFLSVVWLPISLGLIFVSLKRGIKFADFIFQNRFILAIGNLSLEIFLIHLLVIRYGNSLLKFDGVLESLSKTLIYFVITLIAAIAYKVLSNLKFYTRGSR